ncbi:hypothetical protein ACWF82_02975 [Nocardia sp. NPDC055053]
MVTHDSWAAHKIGVSGLKVSRDRLAHHQKYGWNVLATLHFSEGATAYAVEQSVLKRLRNEYGLQPYLSSAEMPQGGATETVDAAEISLVELWKIVEDEAGKMRRPEQVVPRPDN